MNINDEMFSKLMSGDFWYGVLAGWVGDSLAWVFLSIFAIFCLICRHIKRTWFYTYPKILVSQALFLLVVGLLTYFFSLSGLVALVLTIPGLAIPGFFLRDFQRLGIVNAYLKSSKGIDANDSLRHVSSNTLRFLGIGASKLTASNDFASAMEKCAKQGKQARFLLTPPNNPVLDGMAAHNNTNANIYNNNVKDSLRRLSRLKVEEGFNIEVKFYQVDRGHNYQRFRMFIVEDDFCLLSWTVWGPHMGADNPQILIRKPKNAKQPTNSLYKALQDYFDAQWDVGKKVCLDDIYKEEFKH